MRDLADLFGDLVGRADDDVAVFDDGVELAGILVDQVDLLDSWPRAGVVDAVGAAGGRCRDLAFDAGALGRLGNVARRVGVARADALGRIV